MSNRGLGKRVRRRVGPTMAVAAVVALASAGQAAIGMGVSRAAEPVEPEVPVVYDRPRGIPIFHFPDDLPDGLPDGLPNGLPDDPAGDRDEAWSGIHAAGPADEPIDGLAEPALGESAGSVSGGASAADDAADDAAGNAADEVSTAPAAPEQAQVAGVSRPHSVRKAVSAVRREPVPTGCRPATRLLATEPVRSFGLPGGASVRIWDTGSRSQRVDELRVAAVRIPAGGLVPGVLAPRALGTLATPESMAGADDRAVVVINGGVYDVSTAIPTGPMQLDGRPQRGDSKGHRSVAIYPDQRVARVAQVGIGGAVRSERGRVRIAAVNWEQLSGRGATAYTRAWPGSSHPAGDRTIVISDDKVREILTGWAGQRRPGRGETFVTARPGSVHAQRLSELRVGDVVDLDIRAEGIYPYEPGEPVMEEPAELIGVSAALVKNGKVQAPCSARDNQLRPRSAIGWTEDGDMLIVAASGRAVVDGMQFGGASAYGWAQYLKQLGAHMAVNLDGGGSTALLVRREVGGTLQRLDRPGHAAQRAVANGLHFRVPPTPRQLLGPVLRGLGLGDGR